MDREEGSGQVYGADPSSPMEEGGSQEVVADVSGHRESDRDREARQQLGQGRRIRERSRSPLQKERVELEEEARQDFLEDNILAEQGFDREALDQVFLKVKKMEDVTFVDLEEMVEKGMVEELVETLESTVERDVDIEKISKAEMVTMMSNIEKILDLDLIPEELKGRIVNVGLKFLEGLAEVDWASVSSREAKVLKRLMTKCTMPTWVRAVLDGLLTVAESETEERDFEKKDDLKTINKELDKLVEKIVVNPPNLSGKSSTEAIDAKINIIASQLKVGNVVHELEMAVKELKQVSCVDKEVDVKDDEEATKSVLKSCRDVDEINKNIVEFHCQGGIVQCIVCTECKFEYQSELQTRGKNEKIPQPFSNLKVHLLRHLTSLKHKRRIRDVSSQQKAEEKQLVRNKEIGQKLGKVIYLMSHRGLPFTLYTELVKLLSDFHIDVGDINHGKDFCRDFAHSIAQVRSPKS